MSDAAPIPGLKPKHEHMIMLVAAIVTIAGAVIYLRSQSAAAAAASAGTGYETTVGDTGGGTYTGGDTSGAISQALAAYQAQTDQAITGLQSDFEQQLGQTNDNLSATQSAFEQAIQTLSDQIGSGGTGSTGTGTGTGGAGTDRTGTVSLDLSTAGSYTSLNDRTWNNASSEAGSNASQSTSSNSSSGSGGISLFGVSLFGGGGGSGSKTQTDESSYADSSSQQGSSNQDLGTTFSQTIQATASGLDDDALYELENQLVYTARNAQTAAVDPAALVPSTTIGARPKPLSGGAGGYNRPAQYTSILDVGHDGWLNNWGHQTAAQLPDAALATGAGH